MIAGVSVVPLKIISDERGAVMHLLRCDAPHFSGFGEVYFSVVNAGAIKGWKRHREMTLNLAAPSGNIRLALQDGRSDSPTHGNQSVINLGPEEDVYRLVVVPPGVWTAFMGIGPGPSVLVNCATHPHDPSEAESVPFETFTLGTAW